MADRSDAILERFLALHPRKIDLSLGRIEALLHRLGDPHLQLPPLLHVAGTNGKGSTIAFARSILEAAGKKVHVYTSPHLVHFHERIRLAGQLVSEEELVWALTRCEEVNDGAPITVFEIITAAAFLLFHRHPADCLLLEVGLGGRFDATNVIASPRAALITPISYDHMEFLGHDISSIAFEKAGILKSGVTGFIGPQMQAALEVIQAVAHNINAPLKIYGQDFHAYQEHGRFVFQDDNGLLDLPMPALMGLHQYENAALALASLRSFDADIPYNAFEAGMREVQWPARLQLLNKGPLTALGPDDAEIWLDGGHNEAGGRVLSQALQALPEAGKRPLIMICGNLTTKDTAGFLRHFKDIIDHLIAVPIAGEHASRAPEEIEAFARAEGISASCAHNVAAALQSEMMHAHKRPRILIAGSLYLAGLVLNENNQAPT